MQSPATREYKKTSMTVLAGYFVIFGGTMFAVDRFHPTGLSLYAFAVLPMIPLVTVFLLTARYLVAEKDDFKRDLFMRCLLSGTAASLTVNLFAGFLRIFGWKGSLMPFTELYVFCLFVILAKLTHRFSNPLPAEG
jgi:hypothetical protein